jgi:hypothetical protein
VPWSSDRLRRRKLPTILSIAIQLLALGLLLYAPPHGAALDMALCFLFGFGALRARQRVLAQAILRSPCRHKPRHVAGEVAAVVVIGIEYAHVPMPGEFLHRPHVALRKVEGGSNGEMSEPVRTDREPGFRPEPAHDVIAADRWPSKLGRDI